MHNREIRSRSLMNCPPQDTGVALLQSGNDKQILYQHHIHIQKFKIKNRTRSFQFSRQLSFCLLYHHQAGSHEAGRVLFTREALFSQSLGNLGGCLGSRGGNEGIWRCRGTDAPWRVSEPPTQVNHPVLSSAKCAQA